MPKTLAALIRAGRRVGALVIACTLAVPAVLAQQTPSAPVTPPPTDETDRDRVTVTGMVPVPDVGAGAPLVSADELKQQQRELARDRSDAIIARERCEPPGRPDPENASLRQLYEHELELIRRIYTLTDRAAEAAKVAEQARFDAGAGRVGMDVVIETELARQYAMNELDRKRLDLLEASAMIADYQEIAMRTGANFRRPDWSGAASKRGVPWADLYMRADKRRAAGWGLGTPPGAEFAGLSIQNVRPHLSEDRKGFFISVAGEIRNDGKTAADIPPIRVSSVDEKGFVLSYITADAPRRSKVPAGGTTPFAYELRPAPEMAASVSVVFASKIDPPPRMPLSLFDECNRG